MVLAIFPSLQCASIDHAIYFHRPLRADEWMLYDMEATVSAASRGLNFGSMWQNTNSYVVRCKRV